MPTANPITTLFDEISKAERSKKEAQAKAVAKCKLGLPIIAEIREKMRMLIKIGLDNDDLDHAR